MIVLVSMMQLLTVCQLQRTDTTGNFKVAKNEGSENACRPPLDNLNIISFYQSEEDKGKDYATLSALSSHSTTAPSVSRHKLLLDDEVSAVSMDNFLDDGSQSCDGGWTEEGIALLE